MNENQEPNLEEKTPLAEANAGDAAPSGEQTRQLRGLYRHVKISVKTLDLIIVLGVAAIIAVLLFGVSHSGYTATFDANGGTDVPSQSIRYGDYIVEPEDPTREGYTFGGWYLDESFDESFDFAGTQAQSDLELHALWIEN